MSPKKNIRNIIPPNPENPFRVPEGYFDDVQQRVMKRIRDEAQEQRPEEAEKQIRGKALEQDREEAQKQIWGEAEIQQSAKTSLPQHSRRKKLYLQPYISLAAAISGVALVVYIVLQSVMGSRSGDDNAYDIAMLDRAGIMQDEALLAEAYTVEDEDAAYSEWDEEAITYLASNEVDLIHLLDNN